MTLLSDKKISLKGFDKQVSEKELVDSLWAAPFDPRFPNQNQTRYCYQSYLDYHRCVKARGEDYEACQYFKKCYLNLCPKSWYSKWDDQVSENRFAGNI